MADLTEGLFARWSADADLTAIVGTRFYPVIRPQKSPLPAIRYQVISDPRPEHLKGYDGRRVTRVQVDCFATSYLAARQLAALLIAKMIAPTTAGGISFGHTRAEGPRDLGEETTEGFIHRASTDLLVEHGLA